MKLQFFIPSLLAAGFLPANNVALAAVPARRRRREEARRCSTSSSSRTNIISPLIARIQAMARIGSHRSSGGGPVYTPPRATPAPSRRRNSTIRPLRQQILPSPPVAPKTLPGNTAKFRSIVMHLQTCLSLFGFYPGAIDGAVGPETAAAISKFQEQWGFPITGTVTPEVLDACGIAAQ